MCEGVEGQAQDLQMEAKYIASVCVYVGGVLGVRVGSGGGVGWCFSVCVSLHIHLSGAEWGEISMFELLNPGPSACWGKPGPKKAFMLIKGIKLSVEVQPRYVFSDNWRASCISAALGIRQASFSCGCRELCGTLLLTL